MNQRQHDMGGMDAGPIESSAHDAEPWAKMITSLAAAMRDDDIMRIDELRRALEDLPPDIYSQDYFERWSEAMINLLEEKGVWTRDEVMGRMDAIKAKLEG
ncbi:MAG: hypothetical protein CMM12_03925 [Rhodospirillaceae bacterium]|jgi:hypothetical protein|nr:hypothetical protein [Rhodospirillaceae bacterium]|tara:strand:+ start:109 stop:411 length:303 start_codon:yes stop_codon:yes gene_type:complete